MVHSGILGCSFMKTCALCKKERKKERRKQIKNKRKKGKEKTKKKKRKKRKRQTFPSTTILSIFSCSVSNNSLLTYWNEF